MVLGILDDMWMRKAYFYPDDDRTWFSAFADVLALKVAVPNHSVGGYEGVRFISKHNVDLVRGPDEELAVLPSLSAS